MKKLQYGLLILLSIFNGLWAGAPLSKEVSFKETYSSAEVTLKATGLGESGSEAIADLKKAAIWFVLLGGTDPMLNSAQAKNRFEAIANDFYKSESIMSYITWEAQKVTGQVKVLLPNGERGVKITKMLRVQKKKLRDDLVAKGVLESSEVLSEAAGMPFIMVIPDTPEGQTPMEVFSKNPLAKHAAGVIESYLTARKYDVVVPRAIDQLNKMTELHSQLKPAEDDVGYQLAMSLGSDIYLTYSGQVDKGKASVVVKAYETTTGRLLGTETGYSQTRPGVAMEPLVEEAVNDAVTNVLQRVNNYWLDDLKKGRQYRVVFKVTGEFSDDEIEEIQFEISDLIEDAFDKSKENAMTEKTLDFIVWAKSDDFSKGSKLYRFFKSNVKKATINKIALNKKMLIFGIDEP